MPERRALSLRQGCVSSHRRAARGGRMQRYSSLFGRAPTTGPTRLATVALASWALALLLAWGGTDARAQGQPPDATAEAAKEEKARLADTDTIFALTND